MPAWAFVGHGLDCLRRNKQLHWITLLFGTVLCAFCALMLGALITFLYSSERDTVMRWAVWGLALWTPLFGIFAFLAGRQIVRRRRDIHLNRQQSI